MTDLPEPLRWARTTDAETMAAYHVRCWEESFRAIAGPAVMAHVEATPMPDRVATWHRRLAADAPQRVVVTVDDRDRAIGHVMVDGAELVHLFIDPDHHRRGWGQILLDVGEHMIRDDGHPIAELHTLVGNAPAIALYEANGWVVTDEYVTNDLPNGSSFVEHVLRKVLDEPTT
jgi:ribosomal protein S18 acetylase RimI-like enzyme